MRGKRHSELPYPQTWALLRATVLVYMERDGKYLMLHRNRKENDLNEGKWIGVGGKKKRFEFIVKAMLREVKEETGVTLTKWRYRGVVEFHYETTGEAIDRYHERVYLFTATDWEGEVNMDCPEGTLEWVNKEDVPKLNLWRGDRIFLKALADDMKFFFLMLDYAPDGTLIDAALNLNRIPVEPWNIL